MSCYEWEAGTIKLPSAAFPQVHKAVVAAALAHQTRLFDEAQKFWKVLPARYKRNKDLYRKAVTRFIYGDVHTGARETEHDMPRWTGFDDNEWNSLSGDLHRLLTWTALGEDVVDESRGYRRHTRIEYDNPKRITKKMVQDFYPATNRTLRFECGEPSMDFDREKRTVAWSVPENNHAREGGRNHPVAQALFRALDKVKWTRGSGGQILGNDEYNRESAYDHAGGGGSYVIEEYGPKVKRPQTTFNPYRGW